MDTTTEAGVTTECLACHKPQNVEPATLCDHCLAKSISLLNQGHTPSQIAQDRDDIRIVLEGWVSSKGKAKVKMLQAVKQTMRKKKESVSRETLSGDALAMPHGGQGEPAARSIAILIPIDAIEANPYQPRKVFSEQEMQELVDSIREHGVLQPILVRPNPDDETRYQLIAGERRWRASQEAGLMEIEAVVRQKVSDQVMAEMAIIENVQRHDMTAIEQAKAYKRLVDEFGLTADYIARRIGISRSAVANRLRLLYLPDDVQGQINDGRLSEAHGRAMAKYKKYPAFISFYAGHIIEKQLTSKLIEAGLHFQPGWPECNTFANDLAERGLLSILHSYDYQFVNDEDVLFEYPDDVFRGCIEEDGEFLFCLNTELATTLHAQWNQRAEDERKAAQEAAKNSSNDTAQGTSTNESTSTKKTALERYQVGEIKSFQDLHWNEYDRIHNDCPKACSLACECRVVLPDSPGSDYRRSLCLDPKRHRALKAQESRVRNKARRENIAQLSDKIFPAIDERYDALLEGDILPILALAAFEGMNAKSVAAAAKRLNIDFDFSKFSYDSNRANKLTMLSKVQGLARFTIEAILRDELRKAAENDYDKPTRTKWLIDVMGVDNAD